MIATREHKPFDLVTGSEQRLLYFDGLNNKVREVLSSVSYQERRGWMGQRRPTEWLGLGLDILGD